MQNLNKTISVKELKHYILALLEEVNKLDENEKFEVGIESSRDNLPSASKKIYDSLMVAEELFFTAEKQI
jgi:hypothetical protein